MSIHNSRIRIARVVPRDVPYAIATDMAGATGNPDTRSSNELHTKTLPKRSGPHGKDVSRTTPLGSTHDPLYLHGNDEQEEGY
jgi:hypothetical protein